MQHDLSCGAGMKDDNQQEQRNVKRAKAIDGGNKQACDFVSGETDAEENDTSDGDPAARGR